MCSEFLLVVSGQDLRSVCPGDHVEYKCFRFIRGYASSCNGGYFIIGGGVVDPRFDHGVHIFVVGWNTHYYHFEDVLDFDLACGKCSEGVCKSFDNMCACGEDFVNMC